MTIAAKKGAHSELLKLQSATGKVDAPESFAITEGSSKLTMPAGREWVGYVRE